MDEGKPAVESHSVTETMPSNQESGSDTPQPGLEVLLSKTRLYVVLFIQHFFFLINGLHLAKQNIDWQNKTKKKKKLVTKILDSSLFFIYICSENMMPNDECES